MIVPVLGSVRVVTTGVAWCLRQIAPALFAFPRNGEKHVTPTTSLFFLFLTANSAYHIKTQTLSNTSQHDQSCQSPRDGHTERMADSSKVTTGSWVTKVDECDVLLGRGKRSYNHSGNLRFRDLVVKFAPDYQASQSKPQRKAMAVEIMNAVERSGGKFLKPVDSDKANQGALAGRWEIVPKHIVRTKVKQALRDMPTPQPASTNKDEANDTQPIFKQALESQRSVACSDKPVASGPTAGVGQSVNNLAPGIQLHGAQGSAPTFSFQGVGGNQMTGAAAFTDPSSVQQLAHQMVGLPTNHEMLPRSPQQIGSAGGTVGASSPTSLGLPGALTPATLQTLQMYLASKQREEQLAIALQQQSLLQQQAASPGNLLNFLQTSPAIGRSNPNQPSQQGMGLLGSAIGGSFGEATRGQGRLSTDQGGFAAQSILQALLNQQQQQQQQQLRNLDFQYTYTPLSSTVPGGHGSPAESVDPLQRGVAAAALQDAAGNASYGTATASGAVAAEHKNGDEGPISDADSGTSSNRSLPSYSQTTD